MEKSPPERREYKFEPFGPLTVKETALPVRIKPPRRIDYLVLFLLVSWTMSATASVGQTKSQWQTFSRPDRTITWKPWRQKPECEYRFRTGDRYLGHCLWEHYLAFEEYHFSGEAIKLHMIRLANADLPEDVVICPGLRYAIFKITNGSMTAHKGEWTWTAQTVDHKQTSELNRNSNPLSRFWSPNLQMGY